MILLLVITVINIKISVTYTGFFGEKVCFDSILTSLYNVDAVSFLMDTFWRIENYCYLTRFSCNIFFPRSWLVMQFLHFKNCSVERKHSHKKHLMFWNGVWTGHLH